MKQEHLIVRCTYEETAKTADQVLYESFRLFLQRELGTFANGCDSRV